MIDRSVNVSIENASPEAKRGTGSTLRLSLVDFGDRRHGLRNDEIARRLGTARETVSRWWKRYFEEGDAGLPRTRRG